MKIGDEIYVHGYVDEIRKDNIVIIRNEGGYFGTDVNEVEDAAGIRDHLEARDIENRLRDVIESLRYQLYLSEEENLKYREAKENNEV